MDGDRTLDLSAIGIARPAAVRIEDTEASPRGLVVKLTLLDLTPDECDRLDHYVFNHALPRFLAGFDPASKKPVPDAAPGTHHGVRSLPLAYLPVRGGLV